MSSRKQTARTILSAVRRTLACLLASLSLSLPPLCLSARQGADSALPPPSDDYGLALDFNEAQDYLKAYRHIVLAEKQVDASLAERHLRATDLGAADFRYPYWAVKKSRAEIAYALGLHTDMEAIAQELRQSLEEKGWERADEAGVTTDDLWADLAKIDGGRYYLTEEYDAAEAALLEALRRGDFFGNEVFVGKTHDDLAQLYYRQGVYTQALAHLDTILTLPHYQPDARSPESEQSRMTVLSQRALCLARMGRFAEAADAINAVCAYLKKTGDRRAYAEALRKKGKILMLQAEGSAFNPEAISCYRKYLDTSRAYIDGHFVQMSESQREQYWMAEHPFVTDCFRLEDHAPDLLYDVALYSKAVLLQMGREFREDMTAAERQRTLATFRVTWQQVRDRLPAAGCAIEFVVYEKQGASHLGALVLDKKATQPRFVDIGESAALSDYRIEGRWSVKEVFADTRSRDKINALYSDSTLRHMVWPDALVQAIGNCRDIYFAPDGIYHQLGIEYMTPPTLEGKRFHRLTTTRLLTHEWQPIRTDSLLACGGVEYGYATEDRGTDNDALAYALLAPLGLSITPLLKSGEEIDSIASIRQARHHDGVLRADSLTEEALAQLMGKYHIVHISTHGLFSEVAKIGTDLHPASSDTQLSGSCLFLSGAEQALRQSDFDASRHDGILSARELAKLDLGGVDLAVLSACMSGLGYITPDGVFGLQRGLKTAGVRAIVSTLWSVDDEAASFFVIELYKNLEAGMRLHEAFCSARETLRTYERSYGEPASDTGEAQGSFVRRRRFTVPRFNKPYFYNAFILIDGLE